MAQKQKTPVKSLTSPEHTGWMTKQGGSWKSWKKRWFVLKSTSLYYFKTQADGDVTGVIPLTQESFVKKEAVKKGGRKFLFAVGTTNRVYFMHPETETEQNEWIHHIQAIIDKIKRGIGDKDRLQSDEPSERLGTGTISAVDSSKNGSGKSTLVDKKQRGAIRRLLEQGKNEIAFLEGEDSKVLEFWHIWSESIPPRDVIDQGSILFEVAISGDMEKLTWRASGPQHIFIQKMVDFFWNVGAPETEIDRLNDVGARMNPYKIGSWIDMSAKGGMDGGWFFPINTPIQSALECGEPGNPFSKVSQWTETNNITQCHSVGRDMGAAPPRQTEIRFDIPGANFSLQLQKALTAYSEFGFPLIPDEALEILKQANPSCLSMSVITSSEGFVRLGLFAPNPPRHVVESLCNMSGGNAEQLFKFEKSLNVDGPAYVEFLYLMENFGYGVYKEGFDIVFHYKVGEETADPR